MSKLSLQLVNEHFFTNFFENFKNIFWEQCKNDFNKIYKLLKKYEFFTI